MADRARSAAVVLVIALLLPLAGGAPAPAAPKARKGERLVFSITEARAYAFRVPLRKEVIEAAGARDRVQPCDPSRDPYGCDDTRYEHQPNCPPSEDYGPKGDVPAAEASPGTPQRSGGSGDRAGGASEPARSSPIALNDLVTLGTLRGGSTADARGLASDSYVDLSGRQEPNAHTESDAFSENRSRYEERCWPKEGENVSANHVHVLSRSTKTPSTYHLARCVERGCTFGGPFPGGAERGETIVDLRREGDVVVGSIRALLEDVTYGNGAFTAESIETLVTFRADGTPGGLEWTVATNATGARSGGNALPLPGGQLVSGGPVQAGAAAPYVNASEDGKRLDIVAPGVVVAHPEQSVFFGGAELHASFGRLSPGGKPIGPTDSGQTDGATGSPGNAPGGGSEVAAGGGGGGIAGGGGGGGPVGGSSPGAPVAAPTAAMSASLFRTTLPAVLILVAAGIAFLVALGRWIERFRWGRLLMTYQPFRAVDWLYRAFVKP